MTTTLTAEQIAQGWIAYTGNGEPPFKKEVNGPPFQLGRMHAGELCTTAVITESLPDEIDWSNVAAYRVWVPSPLSPPEPGGAWTDEQISKLGPWQRIMDKDGLDRYRDVAKSMKGHDMAPVNGNSLYRLVGLIDALMAVIPSPATNEPVGIPDAFREKLWLFMLARPSITDDRDTYSDGFTNGILYAIEQVDNFNARLSAAIGEPRRAALEGET